MLAVIAEDPDDTAVRRLQAAVARLAALTAGRTLTGLPHDDADDVAGTVATDDAIGFDPLPLLRALDEYGVFAVVIGQVAGIMHGSAELTGDLDLLWDGAPRQAGALAAAFASVGAELADDDGVPVPCSAPAFGLPKVMFRSTLASGDCCTPALPWGSLAVGEMLDRCREVTAAEGYRIRYLSGPDLVLMRRAVGRVKDLRRARELSGLLGLDAEA
jgi:hypothetical protein